MSKVTKEKKIYDESAIQTLSSLEHIRRRSGMYIGRLGDGSSIDDGIYVLLKEIIDNSIDEFIMGHGKKVNVSLDGKKVTIRDYGRGIPLGKVVECVSTINTGAKYNDDVFQFSVGLNGVGTKAVNALSSHFLVRSHRENKYFEALFSQGSLLGTKEGDSKEKEGTYVEFIPDEEIFGLYHFELDFIEERFFQNVALNHGLEIIFNNKSFIAPRGLLDLLYKKLGDNEPLYDIVHYQGKKLEFAFLHLNSGGESYYSFVNGQFTSDGGTHQSAFREGILKGINEFFGKSYSGSDVREGLVGILSVKVKEPMFESQTKNKLGNTEIRSEIVNETKSAVSDFLHKNTSLAKRLEDKIISNEKLRKELFAVEKEAREKIKKITLKIPQLRDCKIHLGDTKGGEETMVFLTEGQSATGSMISSRDVYRQAIFSLRGKPQNLVGDTKAEIYKNEELFNLMMALGIENSIENLRYEKIIIATDADYDGFHIRNLLLTFFLHYFRSLVINGHIYILETPLFRVRNSSQTIYCYSEHERDKAISHLKGKTETTRFKGLGEISPKEFGQFIHPETMKLISVSVPEMMTIEPTLDFYMGKNTPKRRDFIMENLI